MAFAPNNKNNAISEVAFVISLGGQPEESQIQAFTDKYTIEWGEDLPIKEEVRGQRIQMGPDMSAGPQLLESQLDGARFRTLQRDGTLDWQVGIEDTLVKVNCGSYSRWDNVWPTALSYLKQVSAAFISPATPVVSFGLQYIDEFIWTGDIGAYDASEVFDSASEFFLSHMNREGHLWHLHQGWFVSNNLPEPGRRLERLHIDALEQGPVKRFPTKIDTMLRHDLAEARGSFAEVFNSIEGNILVERIFISLHQRNKEILKSLLTTEMAKRIGLDV